MKKLLFLLLTAFALLSGCSDKSEIVIDEAASEKVRPLINQATVLQEAYTNGRILALGSQQDRNGFENSLKEARFALMLFARNPNDPLAIQLGYRAVRERNQLFLTRGDISLVEDFYRNLAELVSDAARRNNVDLEGLDWRLFVTNFGGGIFPFGVSSTVTNWKQGISLDETYVSVRGPRNKAWLLSPGFDLRNVKTPSFSITHQTRVDINDNIGDAFNRHLINEKTFKAFVSTDYISGKPEEATWTEVSLGQMPSSIDFHTVTSPKIDLSNFISDNTTIALVLDADPRVIGSHYLTWQVSRFELHGNGPLENMRPRQETLYEHLFNTNSLAPFQEIKTIEGSPSWEPFGFSGSFRFAKIGGNRADGETWLLSPKYRMSKIEAPMLTIQETFQNPNYENMEILISTDYNGGDPNLSHWEPIERAALGPFNPGEWIDVNSGPYNMISYLGKDFVIGFKYTAKSNLSNVWEVESINISGFGSSFRPTQYPITYQLPGSGTDPQDEPFAFFNFNEGDQGFTQQKIDADAAEWALSTRQGQTYFLVSGHSRNQVGRVRLISPMIDIEGPTSVQLKHAINFYPADLHSKNLVKVILLENGKEVELKFQQGPTGMDWNIVDSEKLKLPLSQDGAQSIQLIFEYNGQPDAYPNWNLHQVKLFEVEP